MIGQIFGDLPVLYQDGAEAEGILNAHILEIFHRIRVAAALKDPQRTVGIKAMVSGPSFFLYTVPLRISGPKSSFQES